MTNLIDIAKKGVKLAKAADDPNATSQYSPNRVKYFDYAGTHHAAICQALLDAVEALKEVERIDRACNALGTADIARNALAKLITSNRA